MDLPAMFFAGLSLISFWQWQNEIRDRRRLFLAAFFAGFAFLIKATLIFFALALVFYIILVLVRLKISLKKSAVLCVFCIIFFLLPLVPFGIKNSIEAIHQSKSEFATSTFIYGSEGKPIISLNQAEEESAKKNSNIITSSIAAELNRYGNFKNGLSKYIFFPIISTLNSAASGQYVDAGFIFLLFVPLLVLAYPFMARKSDRRHFVFYEMALTGIVYWLLWATFSHGVIWYGFTGFLFLLMLLVEFLNQIKNYKNKFFYLAICVILVFWFSINLLQRTAQMQEYNIYVNKDNLIYAGGKMSDSEYYHRYVSSFAGIVDFINSEIDKNKENPPRVYLIGKYIKFFIKENDKTVYQDNSLSVYMAISDGKTDSSVIDRLKQNNINYIVVEKYSISFFGDSADTLRSKLEKLETTIRNNPDKVKVLYDDKGTGILFAKIL
jgi:hypothetical protein